MERQKVIERLRREKEEAEKSWQDEGCEHGKRWAETAGYESLVRYAEMDPENFAEPSEDDAYNCKDSWRSDPETAPPSEHLEECFWQGWLQGVKEVYESLEGEV
jgi:hypothetical protein